MTPSPTQGVTGDEVREITMHDVPARLDNSESVGYLQGYNDAVSKIRAATQPCKCDGLVRIAEKYRSLIGTVHYTSKYSPKPDMITQSDYDLHIADIEKDLLEVDEALAAHKAGKGE